MPPWGHDFENNKLLLLLLLLYVRVGILFTCGKYLSNYVVLLLYLVYFVLCTINEMAGKSQLMMTLPFQC